MRREETFLERIADMGGRRLGRYQPTTAEDIESLMESVRQHLAALLNARHGMSEALPDYGLPSLVDLVAGTGDHVRGIQEAIQTTIEKYEPRLRRVRVTHESESEQGSAQKPIFRIEGILVGRSGEHRVWYRTEVGRTGEFAVQG